MFEYDFMINAFMASGVIAIMAGVVGYFLVLRGQTFASHALSHVGFTGATGAVLLGISPLLGMLIFTMIAGLSMGLLGEKLVKRDVSIGIILSLALGLGLLFVHFFTTYTTSLTALLFGNILSVDRATLYLLIVLALASLLALALIVRPLIFATLQPELAAAKGLSIKLVSTLFLIIVSVAVAESSQIVGVLLVFTLMVGPAATAHHLSKRIYSGMILAALFALLSAWLGLTLAFYTSWPSSFWITFVSASLFLLSLGARRFVIR